MRLKNKNVIIESLEFKDKLIKVILIIFIKKYHLNFIIYLFYFFLNFKKKIN